jgi:integrase
MLGGIYTEETCPICGQKMKDNHRDAVCCPRHRTQRARAVFVRFGRQIKRKFSNYDDAARFLTGLRFKVDEGSFDVRDYQSDNPLGFENLALKWLALKKEQIKRHSWDNLNNFMRRAIAIWGNRNVKEIDYGQIEDFFHQDLAGVSDKSKANAKSVLHSFFEWLRKRRVLHPSQLPEIPEIKFDLEFRKTISKELQTEILAELWRISSPINPRIFMACRWLSTYIAVRPGELIRLKEGEIDRQHGFLIIPHPKEKKPKIIPLTEDDLELVRSMPAAFPELLFFRHLQTRKGIRAGTPFGPRYLWNWWKVACANLGIEGVDLYGGTRHSTTIYLGEFFTPEEIKQATAHSTNKAFERYYRIKPDQVRGLYEKAKGRVVRIGDHRGTTDPKT